MSREHGKSGRVLLATTGTGVPAVIALNQWTLNQTVDQVEVSSFGDANKTYVTGLKDLQGTISGFWDSADDTLFDASDSADGALMYLYPDASNHPTKYWYGVANVSNTVDTSSSGAVAISGTFSARGSWTRA